MHPRGLALLRLEPRRLPEGPENGHDDLAAGPRRPKHGWNHPVLVDDILLVRNTEEMAAFRLTLATLASDG